VCASIERDAIFTPLRVRSKALATSRLEAIGIDEIMTVGSSMILKSISSGFNPCWSSLGKSLGAMGSPSDAEGRIYFVSGSLHFLHELKRSA
jgi:hypothetical protein